MFKLLTAFFLVVLLSISPGCAVDDWQPLPKKETNHICTDPRPEICTMDYRPVCATKTDGSQATYANGCGACSDPAVVEYREDACRGSQ